MIKFLFLFLLFSCAHEKKSNLPTDAQMTIKKFSSSKEARNQIRNKWNYLFLLFEQSHDPYYGTPKWPLPCLEQNKQGKLTEENGHSFFISTFLLNENKETGYCTGTPTEVIFLHCQDSLNVHEIHCRPGSCKQLSMKDICSNHAN